MCKCCSSEGKGFPNRSVTTLLRHGRFPQFKCYSSEGKGVRSPTGISLPPPLGHYVITCRQVPFHSRLCDTLKVFISQFRLLPLFLPVLSLSACLSHVILILAYLKALSPSWPWLSLSEFFWSLLVVQLCFIDGKSTLAPRPAAPANRSSVEILSSICRI